MLWLTLHNALPTNEFRHRRGMALDDLCKRRCLKHTGLLIPVAMWWILKSRCLDVFQPDDPWSEVKVHGLSRSLHNDIISTSQATSNLTPSLPAYSWVPPPINFYKVNCDASIFHEQHLAGFGCVLMNSSSSWVLGCYGHIPVWSIFRCELLAI
ncbi:hypothetical protein PIB30_063649 [Stylosanthes scabra]|uniref:RNase H type-1 domain-containing protein n=1 Tax=Stylosanthes scabra TaxID=79078 RepID=A0ABU6WJR1_9FABA|nr:hypothetical protein [Stylosanthes scabra]